MRYIVGYGVIGVGIPDTVFNATLYVQLDASDLQIYSLILIEKGARFNMICRDPVLSLSYAVRISI